MPLQNNLEKLIEKAEKYKYSGCRDKFINKYFGIRSYDIVTPLYLIKAVKKVIDVYNVNIIKKTKRQKA